MFYKDKPKLLVASPPCTLFSILQNWNPKPNSEAYEKAVNMIELAVDMCIAQHKAGRKFVFEHPASATSWKLPCLQKLANLKGMYSADFDMCAFGQTVTKSNGETGLAKKRTRIYTNNGAIHGLVDRQCSKYHDHIILVNSLTKQAAIYPQALCDAFIDGIVMEGSYENGEMHFDMMAMADMCDPVEEQEVVESMVGIDDVSGCHISPNLIVKARLEEMRGFKEQMVYHYVLRRIAETDDDGKFIGVRWVDVNKGTEEEPRIRSRLVGQ